VSFDPSVILLDDTIAAVKDQVAADVGGELVILHVASGEYFGLNNVGVRIWELIREPRRASEVRDQLLHDYPDVDPDVCTSDLLALLNDMHAAALVEKQS
jgi:hypothetical protein